MKREAYSKMHQCSNFDFPLEFYRLDCNHPKFSAPYHWHNEYEIMHPLKGSFLISLNEQEVTASAGDIVFIRDGIVHGWTPSSKSCVYEYIVFDMQSLLKNSHIHQDLSKDILNHNLRINNHIDAGSHEIANIINDLFNAAQEKKPGYEFIIIGMLYSFIGTVMQQGLYHKASSYALAVSRHHVYQIKQAFKLIDTSYSSALTLDDLANAAGFSPNYFCRFFQKITHRTPIDYLNYYRIETACTMLAASTLSITDIASKCGFNDLSYFIKIFKKYKIVSPHRYQKNVSTVPMPGASTKASVK